MLNIVHYTTYHEPSNTIYTTCPPIYYERPYRLTYRGARRMLQRDGIKDLCDVTRIEFAHYSH